MAGSNPTLRVARYFVTEVIGRRWTRADFRSRHMKAAKVLLKEMGYEEDAIIAALDALRNRRYEEFNYTHDELPDPPLSGMEILWAWGEPPLIERFVSPPDMPPVYSNDYDPWVRRWGKVALDRGDWDGIYRGEDIERKDWLRDIIGHRRFEESCQKRTSKQQRRALLDI